MCLRHSPVSDYSQSYFSSIIHLMDVLSIVGRTEPLLSEDLNRHESDLKNVIESSRFLVIGGGGSIGQAVTKEIFRRNPRSLHIVDLSENNLVELVRDIRSSSGYISGDFRTFALDCGSVSFEHMVRAEGGYDFVLNLSALKHVRSEKDPYTLMRMVDTNILNTVKVMELAVEAGAKKYFCVSTDKASNPTNMMGASKRIMELFLMDCSDDIEVSMARFANVAFSDGSLLQGFEKRLEKRQPLAAPNDVRRYFLTSKEAGTLCLFSTILGRRNEIFFPRLSEKLNLITFSSIARNFLESRGYKPFLCESEDQARNYFASGNHPGKWPCVFSSSDTTGEKSCEEFYMSGESVDLERFESLGIVVASHTRPAEALKEFQTQIEAIRCSKSWSRQQFIELFQSLLPELHHKETGKFLDEKM